MAKALFDSVAGDEYISESAGLSAIDGSPASENAIKAMEELMLDISSHKAKKITPELIEQADIVVPMTSTHAYILLQYGVHAEKIVLLSIGYGGSCGGGDGIFDPYGGDIETYRQCAQQIKEGIMCTFVK